MPDQKRFNSDSSHYTLNASVMFPIITSFVSKAVSTTITAPLNFIQTRYQVMGQMKKNGLINQNYTSYTNCIISAVKQQVGVKTLWKGNAAKIMMGWMGIIFSLTAGDFGKKIVTQLTTSNPRTSIFDMKYLGSLAGIITSLGGIFVTYPFEYAYVRLVTDKQNLEKSQPKQFSSIRNVLSSTIQTDGIRGLYRGVFTSFGGIALYRGAYFGLYDLWKTISPQPHSIYQTFLYSYLITLTSGAIAYPVNTIRKRMMMRSKQVTKYKWSLDCFSQIVKNQGFMALYRGYPISIISSVFGSFVLMAYDDLQNTLTHKKN